MLYFRTIKADPFTAALYKIYKTVRDEGVGQVSVIDLIFAFVLLFFYLFLSDLTRLWSGDSFRFNSKWCDAGWTLKY